MYKCLCVLAAMCRQQLTRTGTFHLTLDHQNLKVTVHYLYHVASLIVQLCPWILRLTEWPTNWPTDQSRWQTNDKIDRFCRRILKNSGQNWLIVVCHMTHKICRFSCPILSAINSAVQLGSNFADKIARFYCSTETPVCKWDVI